MTNVKAKFSLAYFAEHLIPGIQYEIPDSPNLYLDSIFLHQFYQDMQILLKFLVC
jgi:hypothetical protein